MPSNDDIIFEYPSVYDEYKDEDWYLWFRSDDCPYDEKIDEEDYMPIRKIPKNPSMFVQVCAVTGKQAARIRSPLDRSGFWICDPRLIGARSDRWDFRLEFSTRSYGFSKLLQFVFDSEKHVSLDNNDEYKIVPFDPVLTEILYISIDDLTRSLEKLDNVDVAKMVEYIGGLKIWLSDSLMYQEIFHQGFKNTKGETDKKLRVIGKFKYIEDGGINGILNDINHQIYSNNKVCIGCYCVVTTSNSKSDIFGVPFDRGRFDNTKTRGRVCSKKGRMMRKHLD